jgi:hypothetical protein
MMAALATVVIEDDRLVDGVEATLLIWCRRSATGIGGMLVG